MALQGACKHMPSTLRHEAHSQRPERACNASALVNASHCHLELKQTIRQADCLLRIMHERSGGLSPTPTQDRVQSVNKVAPSRGICEAQETTPTPSFSLVLVPEPRWSRAQSMHRRRASLGFTRYAKIAVSLAPSEHSPYRVSLDTSLGIDALRILGVSRASVDTCHLAPPHAGSGPCITSAPRRIRIHHQVIRLCPLCSLLLDLHHHRRRPLHRSLSNTTSQDAAHTRAGALAPLLGPEHQNNQGSAQQGRQNAGCLPLWTTIASRARAGTCAERAKATAPPVGEDPTDAESVV